MRRTLFTVGAMVGATVAIVGSLTLTAVLIVGHAVGPAPAGSADGITPPGAMRSVPVAGMATAGVPVVQKK